MLGKRVVYREGDPADSVYFIKSGIFSFTQTERKEQIPRGRQRKNLLLLHRKRYKTSILQI
jgi:CRP-like cAMP-binding protein